MKPESTIHPRVLFCMFALKTVVASAGGVVVESSANRYVDAQGVEMISNRLSQTGIHNDMPSIPPNAVAQTRPAPGAIVKTSAKTIAPDSANALRKALLVDPKIQKQRDDTRELILLQEISQESVQLNAARKKLAALKAAGPETIQAANEDIANHQRNLLDLNKELENIRGPQKNTLAAR